MRYSPAESDGWITNFRVKSQLEGVGGKDNGSQGKKGGSNETR